MILVFYSVLSLSRLSFSRLTFRAIAIFLGNGTMVMWSIVVQRVLRYSLPHLPTQGVHSQRSH